MLDTCLHKLGHFFVGELHFAGKDFLLDAGREVVRDVDASRIVAGTENGGTADTVSSAIRSQVFFPEWWLSP